ncbi:hypothetical protein L6452_27980 [Arctium lappa]|uniref:Uncharacterized protein n=1 Tax=Arctium lappa TaxID=4217 RepID=A0ACB9A1I9_ARCLA|nr:hypothetical protein L6452_27980 [Arctium lappa]
MTTILLRYLLLLLIPNYAASFTFNLTDIRQNNLEIVTAGTAYISEEGIQVTPTENRDVPFRKAGRATYKMPLHLWDNSSNELASFSTSFTFVIKSNQTRGDGLTFFLAQDNSVITDGGAIGLPVGSEIHTMTNPFVAVEFDTFGYNDWDPKDSTNTSFIGDHVGININSLISSRYQVWEGNITSGVDCQAWINYDSVLQNLSVSYTCFEHDTADDRRQDYKHGLDYHIDMREVLPEWVIFGFSAATGANFETHLITSWSFNGSDIQIDEGLPPNTSPKNSSGGEPPITSPKSSSGQPPTTSLNQVKNGSGRRVLVGLLLPGLFVLITPLAFVLWRKKKNKGDEVEEPEFAIACGRKPVYYLAPERQIRLVEWVWELYGTGTLLKAADPRLGKTDARSPNKLAECSAYNERYGNNNQPA